MPTSIVPFALAVLAASAACEESLAALLERARAANGVATLAKSGQDLLIEGTSRLAGVPGRWTVRVAADGRFANSIESRVGTKSGFDGVTTWLVDRGGIPMPTAFEQREHSLLQHGLAFGAWCVPGGPLVPMAVEEGVLRIRARDGQVAMEVELDPETLLPRAGRYEVQHASERWRFADWREEGGLQVPHEFTLEDEGQSSVLKVTSARLVPPVDGAFTMPAARPVDATFDASVPARLVGKLTRTRHLLVKAAIDDAPLDWMIFDSGAGSSILSPETARKLGLEPFGEYWIGGAGADRATGHYYEAKQLTVGPVTLQRPLFGELDLSRLETEFGVKFSGILGYNLLQRVVARVDMGKGAVDLFDPATYAPEGVTWRDLLLHGNHPHVTCTFANEGEEEGVFRLDTGAPGVTALFHSPCVRALGLLEGRMTTPFPGLGGVGGESQARMGQLDWFEIGGLTIDEPHVIFVQDEKGALADPWTAGTLGGGFLDRFDLIFDYPHDRIGFVPHEAKR